MTESSIIAKVWNYAGILRDAGLNYTDYISQLTYIIFLKMDFERDKLLGEGSAIAPKYRWDKLTVLAGDELEKRYRNTLEALSKEKGIIGTIFRKAQNKISDPAKLKRIISMVDEQTWFALDVDVKGAMYEGLLAKNASETKAGAGQYFTPRPLIRAIVEAMRPSPTMTVIDPACGTGGFLLAAYDYMKKQSNDRKILADLRNEKLFGADITPIVVNMCAMNLYLHGIGNGISPVIEKDSLSSAGNKRFDMCLTNPPFGKKSSVKIMGDDGKVSTEKETYERDDFIVSTSNKQLNFLQHIMTILDTRGKAAVVLPDNVLFEGGAGEKIRSRLLNEFDLHTILRLPTGIFYAQGVKANVLFFDKYPPLKNDHRTKSVWFYDLRTNSNITLIENSLNESHLSDFIKVYSADNKSKRKESERFKKFDYEEIIKRDKLNLDIFWLKDKSLKDLENLPSPQDLAKDIIKNLNLTLKNFQKVSAELKKK
ncbi:MAG: type I restriction-modification system subunit M [Elusimicrobiota bacterium]|jgi:type I restriction enzyme M protein|nr:type I restriction-modification system subunit M [Elusimicrobiota bacterium]